MEIEIMDQDFLRNYIDPVFVSNKQMDRYDREQGEFVESLCIEKNLEILEYLDNGYMVGLSRRGKMVIL